MPGASRAFVPDERLSALAIRGSKLRQEVAQAVVGGPSVSMSTEGSTELSIELADPGLALAYGGVITPGTLLQYEDLRLVIARIDLTGGPAGTGGMTITARSEVVRNLKRRRGALVMRGRSPSQFVAAECKAVHATLVAQPSASRAVVARDVPEAGQLDAGSEQPSSWTTFRRLADELGFLLFEIGGTVYFGQPSWLIRKLGTVRTGWKNEGEATRCLGVPECSYSEDTPLEREVTVQLPHTRAAEVRTGRALNLWGMPAPFKGRYLISNVETRLTGKTPLTVTAIAPRNPVPAGEQTESGGVSAVPVTRAGSPIVTSGGGNVNIFVSKALAQAGDRYIFGAEARLTDSNPRAFDCSELVEWAAAQAGVRFVDGSANQIAACRRARRTVPVSQGIRTRGALLYKPGHIAISLGDGRTIEARNSRVGVVIGGAGDIRWTEAGLIPGLNY